MTADDVEVVEKTSPFQGHFRLDHYTLKHRLFEGGWSGEMSREIFERGHAVAVLPYDPERDELVLIEQFRPGAYAALASEWFDDGASPWLVECVAGIIEKGENPDDVARREMVEETGLGVTHLTKLFHYLVSPGGSSESVFLYCGRVDATNAGGVHGMTDEHENIRVFSVSATQAFELMDQGRIINAMTIVALQWLKANRDRLRADWMND
ncbi:MAG: NUDIX domain-containing protein [Alphaproteobacteria bacterium]|nr:NUDIX domain-containing protein [Alphaproteobacteria bacterium]MBT7944050.1 NUDIX domain-containing protein [Alphaproteobacteria bacterium]